MARLSTTGDEVHVVGVFSSTADFDPGPGTFNLTSAGNFDVFVWKLDQSIAVIPRPVSQMLASRANPAGTAIDVTWNAGRCPSPGYHLIYGDLPDVAAYTISGSECGLGNTGSATGIPVPPDDLWILVVANDGEQTEGSWGQATGGERNGPVPSGECGFVMRDNSGTCP